MDIGKSFEGEIVLMTFLSFIHYSESPFPATEIVPVSVVDPSPFLLWVSTQGPFPRNIKNVIVTVVKSFG